jgi:hypothetical protein
VLDGVGGLRERNGTTDLRVPMILARITTAPAGAGRRFRRRNEPAQR